MVLAVSVGLATIGVCVFCAAYFGSRTFLFYIYTLGEKKMKKLLPLILAVLMLLSFVACDNTPSEVANSNSNNVENNDGGESTNNGHTGSDDSNLNDNNIGDLTNLKPSEGLEYILSDDEEYYIVCGIGTCTDTILVIPSTYNQLPVKEIYNAKSYSSGAFYLQEQLTGVIVSENITSIGKHAFLACHNLKTIVIGESVVSIGDDAFSLCSNLTNITVDENNITYKAIDGNLYTKDVTKLVQYAVGKKDTSFIIPQIVKSIGYGSFSGCRNLQKIEIPNGVTSIGYRAFSSCSNLLSINIPNSVTEIEGGILAECSNLKNVILGSGIDTISYQMFDSCYNLESIEISGNISSIDARAFDQCQNLKNIYFVGTIKEWDNIEKRSDWNDWLPIILINCSDGIIEIKAQD